MLLLKYIKVFIFTYRPFPLLSCETDKAKAGYALSSHQGFENSTALTAPNLLCDFSQKHVKKFSNLILTHEIYKEDQCCSC